MAPHIDGKISFTPKRNGQGQPAPPGGSVSGCSSVPLANEVTAFDRMLHMLSLEYHYEAAEVARLRFENEVLRGGPSPEPPPPRPCAFTSEQVSIVPSQVECITKMDDEIEALVDSGDPVAGEFDCNTQDSLMDRPSATTSLAVGGKWSSNTGSTRFVLFPRWQADEKEQERLQIRKKKTSLLRRSTDQLTQGSSTQMGSFSSRFITYPNSTIRMIWDIIGGIFIMSDIVSIPLEMFRKEEHHNKDWVMLVYWTLNVPASLTVGFVHNGVAQMDPKAIAVNYMKTWMVVDLLTVLPDWIFMCLAGGGTTTEQLTKFIRVLRLVRIIRLIRLLRLKKVWQDLTDSIDSEYTSIFLNIGKMIVLLIIINHYIGCFWFFISVNSGHSNSWVKEFDFENQPWEYQYAASFHWSITQFTPSSMSVQPQNITERAFAIAVVLFALVGFSYVVGSITSSLAQLRVMQEDTAKQFWTLRRYLRQNSIPPFLSIRIRKYLEHAWQSQRHRLSEDKIKILALLSEQLQGELQCELSVPHLKVHPLLHRLNSVSKVTMQRLVRDAFGKKMLADNDSLFLAGEMGTHMFIIVEGQLRYRRESRPGSINHDKAETVRGDEHWVAEPVLWVSKWVHVGDLVASQDSKLITISPTGFGEVIQLNPTSFHLALEYAHKFIDWLEGLQADNLSDINLSSPEITTAGRSSWMAKAG